MEKIGSQLIDCVEYCIGWSYIHEYIVTFVGYKIAGFLSEYFKPALQYY